MAAPVYRAEIFLPTGVGQLDTLKFSTTGPTGPWTSVTLDQPYPIAGGDDTGALEYWATAVSAALSPLNVTAYWDDSTGTVTFTASATCYLLLSETLAELLGFSNTLHKLGGAGVSSDRTPSGIAKLGGVSVTPPAPKDKATLYEYRGGRFDSYSTMRERWHRVEALVPEATIDVLENSTLLRSGLQLLTLGDPDLTYSVGSWDGQIALTPVPESLRIERVEGEGDDAVISFDAVAGRT